MPDSGTTTAAAAGRQTRSAAAGTLFSVSRTRGLIDTVCNGDYCEAKEAKAKHRKSPSKSKAHAAAGARIEARCEALKAEAYRIGKYASPALAEAAAAVVRALVVAASAQAEGSRVGLGDLHAAPLPAATRALVQDLPAWAGYDAEAEEARRLNLNAARREARAAAAAAAAAPGDAEAEAAAAAAEAAVAEAAGALTAPPRPDGVSFTTYVLKIIRAVKAETPAFASLTYLDRIKGALNAVALDFIEGVARAALGFLVALGEGKTDKEGNKKTIRTLKAVHVTMALEAHLTMAHVPPAEIAAYVGQVKACVARAAAAAGAKAAGKAKAGGADADAAVAAWQAAAQASDAAGAALKAAQAAGEDAAALKALKAEHAVLRKEATKLARRAKAAKAAAKGA